MGFKKCMESFARTETKQKEFKKLVQSAGFSMPDGETEEMWHAVCRLCECRARWRRKA